MARRCIVDAIRPSVGTSGSSAGQAGRSRPADADDACARDVGGAGTAEAMDRQSDEARDIVVKALETRAGATPKERAVVGSMFGLASAIVALVEATQQADAAGIDSPAFMGKLSQVLNLAFDSEVIKETRELIIKNATTNGEE